MFETNHAQVPGTDTKSNKKHNTLKHKVMPRTLVLAPNRSVGGLAGRWL